MARTKEPLRFVVMGTGDFPIDMLRYDRCCPWQEQDSYLIQHEDRLRIVFVESWGHNAPEYARWASFGWDAIKVDAHENRIDVTKRLFADVESRKPVAR